MDATPGTDSRASSAVCPGQPRWVLSVVEAADGQIAVFLSPDCRSAVLALAAALQDNPLALEDITLAHFFLARPERYPKGALA